MFSTMIAALEYVDYVTIFDEDTPEALLRLLRPDILVKGSDWGKKNIVGADFVKSYGGKVLTVDLLLNLLNPHGCIRLLSQ